MAERLSGKEVAAALNEKTRLRVERCREAGIVPALAILRVGEREDDLSYERGAVKRCEALGIAYRKVLFPETAGTEELITAVRKLNDDPLVHGVLIFRPLPAHIDESAVIGALDPAKDVDGITDLSMAGVFMGKRIGFPPCTPQACMEILDYYNIDCTGKRVTVLGRSLVVGRPAAMLLLGKHATVTICHTRTKNVAEECRKAEILIVAAGKAGIADASYVSPGQTVIDVGIHVNESGKLCGDVLFDEAEPVVDAITPVPGGVGSVTTSVLISHVAEAAEMLIKNQN